MAVSKECAQYCKRGIVRYLNGDTKEFNRLVNMAIEFNKQEPKLVECRYKVNGKWVDAKIDWGSGVIYGIDGQVLRRCKVC